LEQIWLSVSGHSKRVSNGRTTQLFQTAFLDGSFSPLLADQFGSI
jgi:hypothetical protein